MIFPSSRLFVTDNSGITVAKCIKIVNNSDSQIGKIGCVGIFSVIKKKPRARLLKSKLHIGMINGLKKKTLYQNGISVSSRNNSIFIVKWSSRDEIVAVGTRIKGPVSVICRNSRYLGGTTMSRIRKFF